MLFLSLSLSLRLSLRLSLPSYLYALLMIAVRYEPARHEFVAILGPRDLNKFLLTNPLPFIQQQQKN